MKPLSLTSLHRVFTFASLAIALAFVGFVAVMIATYGNLMIGVVKGSGETELLARFNAMRFETAAKRLELRQGLPELDPDLADPFGVPVRVQPR